MKLTHFFKLITSELNKDAMALLYTVVESVLGECVVTVKSTDADGNPTRTKLFRKKDGDNVSYIIPLARCPSEDQVDDLAQKIKSQMHLSNFSLETSITQSKDINDSSLSDDDYMVISECFAKASHEKWLAEREKAGWRYGERRDDDNQTHPLIKSWSQLSESEKSIDSSLVKNFINILKENGFKITKK